MILFHYFACISFEQTQKFTTAFGKRIIFTTMKEKQVRDTGKYWAFIYGKALKMFLKDI